MGAYRDSFTNLVVGGIAIPSSIEADLHEFFQAERDKELGRWRWPENPDYVAYADDDGDVVVLNEGTGASYSLTTRRDVTKRNPNHPATKAAQAYFEAHPEPKPWDAAKEGEVWIVTPFNSTAAYPAIFQADMFRDHGGSWRAEDIADARRIWPEPSDG